MPSREDAERLYRSLAPTLDLFMPKLSRALSGHGFHCGVPGENGLFLQPEHLLQSSHFLASEHSLRAHAILEELDQNDKVNALEARVVCKDRHGNRSGTILDNDDWFGPKRPYSSRGHDDAFEIDGRTIEIARFKGLNGMSAYGISVTTTAHSDDGELELVVWRWVD